MSEPGGLHHMIALTARQMAVYQRLWALSEGGTRSCSSGALHIPGVPAATRKHALIALQLMGVLRLDFEGRYRRIHVLLAPDRVKAGTTTEVAARHRNKAGRERVLRDTGDFISALRKANVPLPLNVNTTTRGRFLRQRADARAL